MIGHSDAIRREILTQLGVGPTPTSDLITDVLRACKLTDRAAIRSELKRLRRYGVVEARGRTKAVVYRLTALASTLKGYACTGLEEHAVWSEIGVPFFSPDPENVRRMAEYAVTEMLNNVIDHSGSPRVALHLWRDMAGVKMVVEDRGVGIFKKLQEHFKLANARHVVLELAKGGLTTDPERHTGQGIYFTSRMCDRFVLESGTVSVYSSRKQDWIFERASPVEGTSVIMHIDLPTSRTDKEVFDAAMGENYYGFGKANVVLKLAGDSLVSRSQAKVVMARGDKFREIVLDFTGVKTMGPAFADEVFRVFARSHPDVQIKWMHTTPAIEHMIERAVAAAEAEGPPGARPAD